MNELKAENENYFSKIETQKSKRKDLKWIVIGIAIAVLIGAGAVGFAVFQK